MLPLIAPADEDRIIHVARFIVFIKIAYIQLLHSSIESSMRPIIETDDSEEYNKKVGSFNRLYTWFFEKTNLCNYKSILDMLSTLRNVNHDNGVYYGSYKEIPLKGIMFKFENAKIANFVTWDFLLDVVPNLRNMMIRVVESTKKITKEITDPSI
jgi:hypothetical protein